MKFVTENGTLNFKVEELGLYSDAIFKSTPERLNAVASTFDITDLKNVADTFITNLENAPQYGSNEEPELFLTFSYNEIPAAFQEYFDKVKLDKRKFKKTKKGTK